MSLAASYRMGPAELPASGCRLPAGHEDRIAVFDDLGNELVSAIAPPFVSAGALNRYAAVAKSLPGLDLVAEWRIRRWPQRGQGQWVQVFRDGIERDEDKVADEVPRDIVIACDYRDFARFLVGAGPITNAGAPIRIERGGVTELSCLAGLVLDEASLRHVTLPTDVRNLLAVGLAHL